MSEETTFWRFENLELAGCVEVVLSCVWVSELKYRFLIVAYMLRLRCSGFALARVKHVSNGIIMNWFFSELYYFCVFALCKKFGNELPTRINYFPFKNKFSDSFLMLMRLVHRFDDNSFQFFSVRSFVFDFIFIPLKDNDKLRVRFSSLNCPTKTLI